MSDEKVPGQWITSCLVDIGDLYLPANWDLLSSRAVHSSSSVLDKDLFRNRNITEAMLSPCLTPTLKLMDVS